jgi:hypothetical protein
MMSTGRLAEHSKADTITISSSESGSGPEVVSTASAASSSCPETAATMPPQKRLHSAMSKEDAPMPAEAQSDIVSPATTDKNRSGAKYRNGDVVFIKAPMCWGEFGRRTFKIVRTQMFPGEGWVYRVICEKQEKLSTVWLTTHEDDIVKPKHLEGHIIKRYFPSLGETTMEVMNVVFDGEQIKYKVIMSGSFWAGATRFAADVEMSRSSTPLVVTLDGDMVRRSCNRTTSFSMSDLIRSAVRGLGDVQTDKPELAVNGERVEYKVSLTLAGL